MPQVKSKKITAGSILGVVLLIALFIAKQQGWLPSDNEAGTDTDAPTAQSDRPIDTSPPTTDRRSPSTPPGTHNNPRNTGRTGQPALPGGDGGIGELFRAEQSDAIVTAYATVKKVLPDDNDGSRHQKLIVTLSTGHTVLIAHNIDLAERVPCDQGSVIRFRGEYEWSNQGGVVHWTHHDPAGRHQPGWIEHEGVRYE